MKRVPYYEYCCRPWEEFILHSDLSYSPCCFGPKVGKIRTVEEMEGVWNGETVRKIRRDLLQGVLNPMCVNCTRYVVIENRTDVEVPDDWVHPYSSEWSPAIKSLNILITEKCNLECIMCNDTGAFNHRLKDGPSIPFEFIQRLGEKYFDTLDFLNPNCFGEFFLYEGFSEYLDLVEKHRPKRVEFITNGSLNIRPEVWLKVLKTHSVIGFSLDAATPDTYHLVRVKSDWNRVFRNVEIVKALRKEHGLTTKLRFNFVVMKINLHELYAFVQKAIFDWEADGVCLMHVDGEKNVGRSVLHDPEWRIRYNQEIMKVNGLREKLKMTHITAPGYVFDENGGIAGQPLPVSAEICFNEGDFSRAGDLYAQVCRVNKCDSKALFRQAECRFLDGQATLATMLFEDLLERDPRNAPAQRRLEQLRAGSNQRQLEHSNP